MRHDGVPPTRLTVATREFTLSAALGILGTYPQSTPPRYDLPGPGDPDMLVLPEVVRTRVINSRISNAEAGWFVDRARSAPWVTLNADLRHADPAETDGLYADMTTLYNHFWLDRPRGVSHAKISKVLHIKRPQLYPILDTRLFRAYKQLAREQARRHPEYGYRSMTWAAIREDLTAATRSGALAQLRANIDTHDQQHVRDLANVSDLRLLDMLVWHDK